MPKALRQDTVYKLETIPELTKGSAGRTTRNSRHGVDSYSSPMRSSAPSGIMVGDESQIVFVGNLPLNINQQELCAMFGFYGAIATAQVISNVRNSRYAS